MLLLRTIVPKEIRYNPQQVTINEDLQGAAGGRGQAVLVQDIAYAGRLCC